LAVSKFVPVIVTGEPCTCFAGEKLVMVGTAAGDATVNGTVLIEAAGLLVLIEMTPVVAPVGTGTTMLFAVTLVGVAVLLLKNLTVVVPPTNAVP
jgi:hypothetical protein